MQFFEVCPAEEMHWIFSQRNDLLMFTEVLQGSRPASFLFLDITRARFSISNLAGVIFIQLI